MVLYSKLNQNRDRSVICRDITMSGTAFAIANDLHIFFIISVSALFEMCAPYLSLGSFFFFFYNPT